MNTYLLAKGEFESLCRQYLTKQSRRQTIRDALHELASVSRDFEDPQAKSPYRQRRYYRAQLKSSAIRVQDGKLILSNGRGDTPLVLSWPYGHNTSVLPKGGGRT